MSTWRPRGPFRSLHNRLGATSSWPGDVSPMPRPTPAAPRAPAPLMLAAALLLPLGIPLLAAPGTATGDLPDLVVDSIVLDPAAPVDGDNVTLKVTVHNIGNATAGASNTSLAIDGHLVDQQATPSLAPNATAVVQFNGTAIAGNHTATATADASNDVAESNETNNDRTIAFHVDPRPGAWPDLVVESIQASPANPSETDQVTFFVIIANQGNASAGGSSTALGVDGQVVDEASTPPLAPGNTTNVQLHWRAAFGNHTVGAKADAADNVTESDEGNNVLTMPLHVGGLPDLVVPQVQVQAVPGVAFINATIANQGNASTPGPFDVAFFVDGAAVGNATVNATLAPGQSTTVTVGAIVAPGDHTAKVVADDANVVRESREDNNDASQPFHAP